VEKGDLVQYNAGSVYCTAEVAKMIGTVLSYDRSLGHHVKVYWIDTQRTIWERGKDIQLLEDRKCPGDISST
jgi:hypothetical protein